MSDTLNSQQTNKPVYAIVDLEITDPVKFQQYSQGHRSTIKQFGGTFLAASSEVEVIEGQWHPKRIVVQLWPSLAQYQRWYDSEEYRPWKELRTQAAHASIILVESM